MSIEEFERLCRRNQRSWLEIIGIASPYVLLIAWALYANLR